MNRFMWPLIGFVVLVAFLGIGLTLKPGEVPSPLIDKPAPDFTLPRLTKPEQTFSPKSMEGRVWLLNVWASWCTSCLLEHPLMLEIAKNDTVPIVGLNYKDARDDAIAWLAKHGNAYLVTASDIDGQVGIDYGVYGVPETFVIDKAGIIRYKHIGPLTDEIVHEKILPLVRELKT